MFSWGYNITTIITISDSSYYGNFIINYYMISDDGVNGWCNMLIINNMTDIIIALLIVFSSNLIIL